MITFDKIKLLAAKHGQFRDVDHMVSEFVELETAVGQYWTKRGRQGRLNSARFEVLAECADLIYRVGILRDDDVMIRNEQELAIDAVVDALNSIFRGINDDAVLKAIEAVWVAKTVSHFMFPEGNPDPEVEEAATALELACTE